MSRVAATQAMPGNAAARLGAGFSIFAAIFTANAATPLYGHYQELWGFSDTALTGVFAIYAVGVLLAMLTVSPLSDRLGRRPLILVGILLVASGAVAFWNAPSWGWLLTARLVSGLGTGTLTAAATAMLVESVPPEQRRHAGVLATLCFAAGASAGPALGAVAFHYHLWPTSLPHLFTLGFATMCIIALALARETAPRAGGPLGLRRILPRPPRVPPAIRVSFFVGALGLSLSWTLGALYGSLGPSLALEFLNVEGRGPASLFAALFQGVGGLSQLYFRSRPALTSLGLGPILIIAGLLLVLVALGLASAPLFAFGTVVLAVGGGCAFCGSVGLVSLAAPEKRRGEVFSALYVIAYVALSLPVVLVGLGADFTGLHTAFTIYAIAVGAGALILLILTTRLAGRLPVG